MRFRSLSVLDNVSIKSEVGIDFTVGKSPTEKVANAM